MIARYARMLTWVLDRQGATLIVAIATLALTIVLYIVDPEGLLSGPGHGRDPGHLGSLADDLASRRWPSASRRSRR